MEELEMKFMDLEFYSHVKEVLTQARHKAYKAANFAMVEAYWEIGRSIVEKQGGEKKSEYGIGLLKESSIQMTKDFEKSFTERNLRYMRQFYVVFPNRHALRSELTWTHYRYLIKVKNKKAREFYTDECIRSNWSTRQLERQINSFFYERLLSSQDKLYMPTEEEFKNEINKQYYVLEKSGYYHY